MPRSHWFLLGAFLFIPLTFSYGDDEQPTTIKSIMKVAFKEGLARKVATGKADPEEQQQLLKLTQAMQQLTPPEGDAESWTEKTKLLVEAVQAVVDGQEEGPALLRTATNCMTCHEVHKPQ